METDPPSLPFDTSATSAGGEPAAAEARAIAELRAVLKPARAFCAAATRPTAMYQQLLLLEGLAAAPAGMLTIGRGLPSEVHG